METSFQERLGQVLSQPLPFLSDGELRVGETTAAIVSPHDNREVGSYWVPAPSQVADAVAAAERAYQQTWRQVSAEERAQLLLRLRDIVATHADVLSGLDALEIGKPVTASQYSDIPISLESLTYYAGRAVDLAGSSAQLSGITHWSQLVPYGVVLEVLPWNGPLWTGVQRLAAILAAGNVAIIKPASWASASWLYLAQLFNDVIPPGVLTVLPGPGHTVGQQLLLDERVAMVSLTGGTETGRTMLAQTASQLKRVSVELGGKNPNIILPDADLDTAVEWSVMGAFANSGQVCVSGSRLLVAKEIGEEFVARFAAKASAQQVGNPLDPQTQLGPVVKEPHFRSVWQYIEAGKADPRLKLVTGGEPYLDPELAAGCYIPPTVFSQVPPDSELFLDEIFGPVATITFFADVAEAIELANTNRYGLAAGVFGRDINQVHRVANQLLAGQVYLNQWFSPGVLQAPSQGFKESGLGGVGIEKYLQQKNIFLKLG